MKVQKVIINIIDASVLLIYLLLCIIVTTFNIVKGNYLQLIFMVVVFTLTWAIRKLMHKTHIFLMEIIYFMYTAVISQFVIKTIGWQENIEIGVLSLLKEHDILVIITTILICIVVFAIYVAVLAQLGKIWRYFIPIGLLAAVFVIPNDSWELIGTYTDILLKTYPWVGTIIFGSPTIYIFLLSIGLAESPTLKWLEKS